MNEKEVDAKRKMRIEELSRKYIIAHEISSFAKTYEIYDVKEEGDYLTFIYKIKKRLFRI